MSLKDTLSVLYELSALVQAGRSEVDFAVVVLDHEGYEKTELEKKINSYAENIACCLAANPQDMVPEALGSLLQSMLNCRKGVDLHRARLLRYAGDFGEEASPIANIMAMLIEQLRLVSYRLGDRGGGLLQAVGEELLKQPLTLYLPTDSCDKREVTCSLRQHLAMPGVEFGH